MFTGIVEELGTVEALERQSDAVRLTVRATTVLEHTERGDSIAVNGCCLTVAERTDSTWTADVMAETLAKTGLGSLAAGDRVNLERAVTAGTRLGGHLVQGHVDAVGYIVRREPGEHWDVVTISTPPDLAPYLVDKGSVTVDGVSLTVVEAREDGFTVSLIPETLARTTLGFREQGDVVNLEVRRRVWAWPVGIVGNVLLFSVFIAATFEQNAQQPLFGQAGRQVFFVITSVYGWYRWKQVRSHRAADAPAITPRWATTGERIGYVGAWIAGVLVCQWLFAAIGAGWPAPRWYYWCDAWIFVGSMVATYAMARGWNDFWLAWIAVDLVGVPLLWHSHYYPTAILYVVYGGLVIWGFVVWLRVSRRERSEQLEEALA
jgi:nicotinamide mononucleotide transporter